MATYEFAYVLWLYQPMHVAPVAEDGPDVPAHWRVHLDGFDPATEAAIRAVTGDATPPVETLGVLNAAGARGWQHARHDDLGHGDAGILMTRSCHDTSADHPRQPSDKPVR